MKLRAQFVVCDDDGHEETFTDVVVLEKGCQRIAHLGLALAEAKQTLTALQKRLVEQQSAAFVAAHWQCGHCGKSAVQVVQAVGMDLDAAVANHGEGTARKLYKAVEEFSTYIENNKGFIPNYKERYRAGERISISFVESTVNQMVSKR